MNAAFRLSQFATQRRGRKCFNLRPAMTSRRGWPKNLRIKDKAGRRSSEAHFDWSNHSAANAYMALTVGMNEVFNSQVATQAAWWNRIPFTAWVLMGLIAVAC